MRSVEIGRSSSSNYLQLLSFSNSLFKLVYAPCFNQSTKVLIFRFMVSERSKSNPNVFRALPARVIYKQQDETCTLLIDCSS